MALVRTTLASACALADTQITVASATGFAAGNFVLFGQEVARVSKTYTTGVIIPLDGRGLEGTVTPTTHPTSEGVVTGLPSEFADANFQNLVTYAISGRAQILSSYSAAGALTLPPAGGDAIAMLNGTTILAMTLANPTVDMDGSQLLIVGNGKAAHTVTYSAGFGNVGATSDVVTFSGTQSQAFQIVAANGFWNLIALGTATASVTGPTVA